MNVIPTLLTTSKEEFIDQMNMFQRYYSRIQLDIGDGNLVSNITTQIDEMIQLAQDDMVTFFPSVHFDFHLMVGDFEKELQKIKKLQEMKVNIDTVLINADKNPDIPKLAASFQFAIGLDIFPEVTTEDIARQYTLETIPAIQVMTVNPGFQGSPFLSDMLTKLEQLRAQDYSGELLIDGGINANTIPTIISKKVKPDYLCIGSYLTKAGVELEERVQELNQL